MIGDKYKKIEYFLNSKIFNNNISSDDIDELEGLLNNFLSELGNDVFLSDEGVCFTEVLDFDRNLIYKPKLKYFLDKIYGSMDSDEVFDSIVNAIYVNKGCGEVELPSIMK